MELWFWLALGSSLSFSVSHIMDKVLTDYLSPNLLSAIKKVISGVLVVILSIVFFNLYFPLSMQFWIFILILASVDALGTLLYFRAIKLEDVSKLISFKTVLSVVLPFLIGVLILSESVSFLNGFGVLLLSVGAYVALSEGKLEFPTRTKAVELISLAAIMFTAYGMISKIALGSHPPYILAIFAYFTGGTFLWSYNFKEDKENIHTIKDNLNPKIALLLVAACFGAVFAVLSMFMALKVGKASLVLPIVYSNPIFVVLMSGKFLKEENLGLKIIGSLLIVLGVALVYIF